MAAVAAVVETRVEVAIDHDCPISAAVSNVIVVHRRVVDRVNVTTIHRVIRAAIVAIDIDRFDFDDSTRSIVRVYKSESGNIASNHRILSNC